MDGISEKFSLRMASTMARDADSVLTLSDYQELTGLIYDSVDHPNGFFPFIRRFIEVFDGRSACFAIYNLKAGNLLGVWSANMPQEALTFYADHVASKDVLLKAAMEINETRGLSFVASNLDIKNVEEVRSKTPIGRFMDLLGAQDTVGAVAFRDENYVNFFTMQRAREQPRFRAEDIENFNILLPHINRAVRLYTKVTNLAANAHTPERVVLEDLKKGVLICDASFRIVFKNTQADAIISRNPSITVSEDDLLVFSNQEFSTSVMLGLSSAVTASLEQRVENDVILCLPIEDQNVTITISPLLTSKADSSIARQHRGGALIGLYDWSLRPSVDPRVIRKIFGLTPSEANVAVKLVNGSSISDIASQTYRTRETIKSHLKSVFRKTNTKRQGELVALLAATGEII